MTARAQSVPKRSIGSWLIAGLVGGGVAAILNLVIYFVANAMLGDLAVAMQPGQPMAPLTFVAVIVTSIVPAVLAALVLAVLQRFLANGTRVFQILAVILGLLSLFPALTQASSLSVGLVLASMHIVAVVAIVWALTLRS